GLDAGEELAGGFVVGVLGDELALEGALEDRLAQALAAVDVAGGSGFECIDDRGSALSFDSNARLLVRRRKLHRVRTNGGLVHLVYASGCASGTLNLCSKERSTPDA